MNEQLSWFISDCSLYSIAIPAIVGIWSYKRLNHIQKLLFFLVLLTVITESTAYWLEHNTNNQQVIYHLFTLLEFILLNRIFTRAVSPLLPNFFFNATLIAMFLIELVDLLWLSSLQQFNGFATAIESLFLIFFALSYFYKTMQELKVKHLEKEPMVFISIGILLYFSSSLFIFLFTNYVDSETSTLFLIWGIHGIFSIILNLFYAIALWLQPA